MAISYIDSTSASWQATSGTVAYPTLQADDVLILFCAKDDDVGTWTASGFTSVSSQATTAGRDQLSTILAKVAVGTESGSLTVSSGDNDQSSVTLLCFRGVDVSSGVSGIWDTDPDANKSSGTNDATPTALAITTGVAGAMMLNFHGLTHPQTPTYTPGAPSGWGLGSVTPYNTIDTAMASCAYLLRAAAGTTTPGAWTHTPDDAVAEYHLYGGSLTPQVADPPSITSVTPSTFGDADTGIDIVGTDFTAVEGTVTVEQGSTPTVDSRTFSEAAAGTTHSVDHPAYVDGDYLICMTALSKNEETITDWDGLTELAQGVYTGNDVSLGIAVLKPTGSSASGSWSFTSSGSTASVSQVYLIKNATDADAIVGAGATTTAPDPPSLTFAGDLWLCVAATSWGENISAISSGYGNGQVGASYIHSSGNDAGIGVGDKTSSAASENPGAMTCSSSEVTIAATVGIAGGVIVEQTVTSWGDTAIEFTSETTDLAEGSATLRVTNDDNQDDTYAVTISEGTDDTAILTSLQVTSTFDAVTAIGEVNATVDQTGEALPVTATFDPVVAVGVSNATTVLTSLVVQATLDAVTTTITQDADAPLTSLLVQATLDAVVVQGEIGADAPLTSLQATGTFDPVVAVGVSDATAVLTSLVVQATLDAVVAIGEVNVTATLTTLAVGSTFDPVVTANEVNATATLTTLAVGSTFDAVITVGEVNAVTTLTALPVQATFDPVVTANNVNADAGAGGFTEPFGAGGGPWDWARWETQDVDGTSTITLNKGDGRMVAVSDGTWQAARAEATGIAADLADVDVVVGFDHDTWGSLGALRIIARHDGTWDTASDLGEPMNGIGIKNGGTGIGVYSWINGVETVEESFNAGIGSGTDYWVRFQVFGEPGDITARIKFWVDGAGEPATWTRTATITDGSAPASGSLAVSSSAAASNTYDTNLHSGLQCGQMPLTATFPQATAQGEVNATATCTSLAVTGTFPALNAYAGATASPSTLAAQATFPTVTTVGEVNATAVATTLEVSSSWLVVTAIGEVNAATTLTTLAVGSTFDAVVTANNVNAVASLTTLAGTATFPAAVVANDVNAVTSPTALPALASFPAATAVGSSASTALPAALQVQATFDPVQAVGVSDATATCTALAVTSTWPPVSTGVGATATLTALPAFCIVDAVILSAGSTVTTTTLAVTSTLPGVAATGGGSASPQPLVLTVGSTFPTVTAQGENHATATLTSLPVAATLDAVTAVGEVNAGAVGTSLEAAAWFPAVTAVGEAGATASLTSLLAQGSFPATGYFIDSQATLTAWDITATLPLLVLEAGATTNLTGLTVLGTFPVVTAEGLTGETKGYVSLAHASPGVAISHSTTGATQTHTAAAASQEHTATRVGLDETAAGVTMTES